MGLVYAAINAFIPASFKVERYASFDYSEKQYYNLLRELDNFEDWNPWSIQDTDSILITGESGNVNSKLTFQIPNNEFVTLKVKTLIPTNKVVFHFIDNRHPSIETLFFILNREESGKVTINVGVQGKRGFPFRLFNLMMDKRIGPDLDTILNRLSIQRF